MPTLRFIGRGSPLVCIFILLIINHATSEDPTCMYSPDFQKNNWAFESPFGTTATNTCITYYGVCDPSSKQNTTCGCTCVCPDGRAGFFCNETLDGVSNDFGFARALQRRFWTSSLKINGSIGEEYKRKYNTNERMQGWTIEYWLRAYTSGVRVTAGTVLFEFRSPAFPCADPNKCKNGDDANFVGSDGYVWSLLGYYGQGLFNLYAELRSNASYARNGYDYRRIASKLGYLDASGPQHIAITMSREKAAVFRSGFSSSEYVSNVTVLRVFRNTAPLLQVVLPYDTDFESRPLYIGPWDVIRGKFTSDDDREVQEDPAFYRRDNSYAAASGTPFSIIQQLSINSFYDALVADEFRFWSRALSEDELAEVASKPLTGSEQDLMIYWDFNDAIGLVERNKATRFNDTLHGIHVVDDVKSAGDDAFWAPNGTFVFDPRIAPLSQQPQWNPTRGGSPSLPEAIWPAFVTSFVDSPPRPAERSPFGVYERGYGPNDPNAPPLHLTYHASAGHGDLLYTYGGYQGPEFILSDFANHNVQYEAQKKIWIYNTVTAKWQPPIDLSSQLSWAEADMIFHTAAVVEDTVYFLGALSARPSVITLNTQTLAAQVFSKDEWLSGAIGFGVGQRCDVVGRKIYCFGGGTEGTLSFSSFPTLTVLDVDSMTMTFDSPSLDDKNWPTARMSHFVLAYTWKSTPGIVVFGGGAPWQENFAPANDSWFYNTTSSAWEPFASKLESNTLLHLAAQVPDRQNRRVISIGGLPYRGVIEELATNGSVGPSNKLPQWNLLTPTARVYFIDEEAEPFVSMSALVPDASSALWIPENLQFFGASAALFPRGQSYEVFAHGGISLVSQAGTGNYIPSPVPKLIRIVAGCQSFLGINLATGLCEPCSQTYRSQPVPGEGGCALCPGGLMSAGTGSPCEPCPSGQYRPGSDPSILVCRACPSGQQPNAAQDACVAAVGSNNANFAYIVIPLVPLMGIAVWLLIRYGRQKQEERRVARIVGEAIDEKQYNFSFLRYDDLEVGEELGSGSFGSVYKGVFKDRDVAIKVSKPGAAEGVREFLREAEVMMTLTSHPNVLQLVGVCTHGGSALVVLEFVAGGSLDKVLQKTGVPQEHLKRVIHQICSGLKHLHGHNLIHRDLACRNILCDRDDSGQIIPKIADFGMSRLVEAENKRGKTATQFGPVPWMAPEAIGELNYSPESDVWSLGITIWELVTRQDPSKQMGLVDLAVAIRDTGYHPKIPAWAPDWLREIFDGCWRKKPEERMTLDDILSVLGLSADEIATVQPKRKSTSVTSGYAQIDSTSPKSSKKNRKAKQKSKEAPKKDEDVVALLRTARDEQRSAERRLFEALSRDNELRDQLGYERRAISGPASKILTPSAEPASESKKNRRKSTAAFGSSSTALAQRD